MTQVNQDTQAKIAKLEAMLEEDTAKNMYRIDRAAFTDEELFELEMKHIFEGNWIFLAHESQIPNVNDYLNIYVGRQPVLITRDKTGQLHAMANTCTHRGATLARHKKGNKSSFTCPFHGWTFNNSGKLLKVKDQPPDAGYPECFNKNGSHDLVKLGAFENYRGFLFGSINPDVVPLADYLGEAAKIIDMIVDQAPDGIEVLRGIGAYTFDANWKLQAENGADGYHVSAVHWNYAATTARRGADGKVDNVKAMNAGAFRNGGSIAAPSIRSASADRSYGSSASAPKGGVIVNITNNTNSEVTAKQSGFEQSTQRYILDIVIDGAQRNVNGFGNNLKAVMGG